MIQFVLTWLFIKQIEWLNSMADKEWCDLNYANIDIVYVWFESDAVYV